MAMRIYRLAHWLWRRGVPFLPWLLKTLNRIVFALVLPPTAQIGRGVLLSYEGLGTVIHRNAVIGDGVAIGAGVTIGGHGGHDRVPVIEVGVMIGTGAKILDPLRIGRYASIGANAVVLSDVPDYGVAVGNPAKVIRSNRPKDIPDYRVFRRQKD